MDLLVFRQASLTLTTKKTKKMEMAAKWKTRSAVQTKRENAKADYNGKRSDKDGDEVEGNHSRKRARSNAFRPPQNSHVRMTGFGDDTQLAPTAP